MPRPLFGPDVGNGIAAIMVAVRLEDGRQLWIAGRCSPYRSELEIGFERDVVPMYAFNERLPHGHYVADQAFKIRGELWGFEGGSQWREGAPDWTDIPHPDYIDRAGAAIRAQIKAAPPALQAPVENGPAPEVDDAGR